MIKALFLTNLIPTNTLLPAPFPLSLLPGGSYRDVKGLGFAAKKAHRGRGSGGESSVKAAERIKDEGVWTM